MSLKDVLGKINDFQSLAPEFGEQNLTNHLPMAQFALHQIGAGTADLDRFTNHYVHTHDLHPQLRNTEDFLTDENWRENCGRLKYYFEFRTFFWRKLRDLGLDQFLKIYFNALLDGVSTAAYHSLIRLAYGVESKNEEEIISGMAYLADAHTRLCGPLPEVSDSALSLREQLAYVSDAVSSGQLVLPDSTGVVLISEHMNMVSQPEVLASVSDKVAIPRGTSLKDFAGIALSLYLATKNFTSLHTVTSCHAARLLLPFVEDEGLFLRYLHQAFLAAYLTIGAPQIVESKPPLVSNEQSLVEEIKLAAQKATDDHDIKLTHTVLSEYQTYKNDLYLKAAVELYPQLEQNNAHTS